MGSLTKDDRSPFWIACFTASDGRQLKKSTKVRHTPLPGQRNAAGRRKNKGDARREAWEICLAIQQAEELAGAGNATEQQLRRVLSETLIRIGGGDIKSISVRQWLEQWIASKRAVVADATLRSYKQTIRDFLEFLGKGADSKLETVSAATIAAFRDHLRDQGLNTATIRKTVKGFLNAPFNQAWRMSKLALNPVRFVEIQSARDKRATRRARQPFTANQIKRLLAAAPDEEWRLLITIGFYTGARLRDCLSLTSSNVELDAGTITFTQKKTGAEVVIPMHSALRERMTSVNGALFPALSAQREGGRNGLSVQFQAILKAASIDNVIVQQKSAGRGRSIRALTFHSLRHSFATALASAGVPPELRRELTGHQDAASHARYTHHELNRLRDALALIPSL